LLGFCLKEFLVNPIGYLMKITMYNILINYTRMLFRAVLKGDVVITEESKTIWNMFKNMTVID
jgi:hypothetical protein